MRVFLFSLTIIQWASGLDVLVDYRYDSRGFFDDPDAREAIEAVARRWSRIIDQSLSAVDSPDDEVDRRFLLRNPSTGNTIQVSSAASPKSDALVRNGAPPANEYWDGITIPEDIWIVYVGARRIDSLAAGGPLGGGMNFESVFDEPEGLLNRGFNSGFGSLTVLGGNITFDLDENWDFNYEGFPAEDKVDFYSIALHEMGHCFGLAATGVEEWSNFVNGQSFVGPNALAAFRLDNGDNAQRIPLTGIRILNGTSRFDFHWKDGQVPSRIFQPGLPNDLGTVGPKDFQEALMSSTAAINGLFPRLELTNVDVAALEDLGWKVISGDLPRPQVIALDLDRNAAGKIVLTFASEPRETYTIQTSPDTLVWESVAPDLIGEEGTTSWTVGSPGYEDPSGISESDRSAFFRVVKKFIDP